MTPSTTSDFRFAPRCSLGLGSSGMLRGVGRQVVIDVSQRSIDFPFKDQSVQEGLNSLSLGDGRDRLILEAVTGYQSKPCNIPGERRSYLGGFCVDITKHLTGKCSGNISDQFVNPLSLSSSHVQIKPYRIIQFPFGALLKLYFFLCSITSFSLLCVRRDIFNTSNSP